MTYMGEITLWSSTPAALVSCSWSRSSSPPLPPSPRTNSPPSPSVARVVELPEVRERMYAMSFEPSPTTPEEYDQIMRKQYETFTRVAKTLGLIK